MQRYFTHYWTNRTWEINKNNEEPFIHTAGNGFKKHGVSIGDTIYVVTVIQGKLYISGKIPVGKICDVYEAAATLGLKAEDLWQASEHIISSTSTPTNFNLRFPLDLTQKLEFKSNKGTKKLLFKSYDYLDSQTLRGIRELELISAMEIEKFLSSSFYEIFSLQDVAFTEEVINAQDYYEGATKQIRVNSYERNTKAKEACIRFYTYNCFICNFNFKDVYSALDKDFIHVHHLKPLSEIRKEYKVDPIRDLRPVCANCHAVIHSRKPAYTMEEMKEMYKNNYS